MTLIRRLVGSLPLLLVLVGAGAASQPVVGPGLRIAPPVGADRNDELGRNVDINGDRAIVSVRRDGVVYVFDKGPDGWALSATLTGSQPAGGFGWSLALDGDRIVVGATFLENPDSPTSRPEGGVFVFERQPSGVWRETALIRPSPGSGGYLGWDVDLDGERILAGAPSVNGGAGEAYVIERAGGAWAFADTLSLDQATEVPARFGVEVALDGERAVVRTGSNRIANIYEREQGAWQIAARLTAPADDRIGGVAISGDRVAVARNGSAALPRSVHVLERTDAGWVTSDTLYSGLDEVRGGTERAIDFRGDRIAVSVDFIAAGEFSRTQAVLLYRDGPSGWGYRLIEEPEDARGFGLSVALSDDRLLVGAPYADLGPTRTAGAAFVYEQVAPFDDYQRTALLSLGPQRTDQRFGEALALDGGRMVVGAPGTGALYVYAARPGAGGLPVWTEEARIEYESRGQDQIAVDLDGTRLVVSGRGVRVYDYDGRQWVRTAVLYGGADGAALSLDGDRLLVGSRETNASSTGTALVFEYDGDRWQRTAALRTPRQDADERVGRAVALDGTRALVAAEVAGGLASAGVSVFEFDGVEWHRTDQLQPGSADGSGGDVALDGGRALVGAPDLGGASSGPPDVSVFGGTGWVQTATLANPDGAARFGASLALDGDRALVGAPSLDGDGAGAAYAFEFDGVAWSAPRRISSPDGADGSRFGASVAVDGRRYLVGAPLEATDGRSAGAVYLFPTSSAVPSDAAPLALAAGLSAPFPNPSASVATLRLTVPAPTDAVVTVYDALGRTVQRVLDRRVVGSTEVSVDVRGLAPGVYVVRATLDGVTRSQLLTVVR